MNENQSALIQLVDKIEQLGQFQDKIEFPTSSKQIWDVSGKRPGPDRTRRLRPVHGG
jgi:hypothetical protein